MERLRLRDFLLVGIFSAILFGYAGISGRPLTMHEARLPQTSREMLATHIWLLPHSGIRPWLERPPLPHWIVIAAMKAFGHDDREWIVRLPSAVMGVLIVLLVGWMAGKWFGRTIGVVSALILATSFEFYSYASLAEDDIYLGALVTICIALFAHVEFFSAKATADQRIHFLRSRPWQVWLFFITLGLTNMTKGPLLGLIIVGSAVGFYLLCNAILGGAWRRFLRYAWLWGLFAMIALTIAWPAWAYHVYPDVLDNWKYDYLGRMSGAYTDINQRWYYYAPALAAAMAPWTPACLVGLAATALTVFRRSAPELRGLDLIVAGGTPTDGESSKEKPAAAMRFVWCWAILPLIVLSIPKGKHHHYVVPFLAPWAILAAFGVVEIGKALLTRRGPDWLRSPLVGLLVCGLPAAVAIAWFHAQLPGPARLTLGLIILWLFVVATFYIGLSRASGRLVLTSILCLMLFGYCWGETFLAARTDRTIADTAFLQRVRNELPPNAPLFVNAKLGPVGNLDFFRVQFYLPPSAKLLHNLSYLRDENIKDSEVYVITRARDEAQLKQLGSPTLIDQSELSHDLTTSAGRFSLFKLTFDPSLKHEPAPTKITNMQAMERQPGPWCGPEL